ncbi:MAG TPA: TIGR02757 family protein [Polyangiaceae bacterium]|nr:TIGR02757 family protein [Polyangiaceae bacterium]
MPLSDQALREALDAIVARTDRAGRLARDPVRAVHRYADPLDQELVGLLAASLAFGNAGVIVRKLDEVLERLGPRPSLAAEAPDELGRRLGGFRHRVYRGDEVARLLGGARRVQAESGTLGDRFARELGRAGGQLKPALGAFAGAVRRAGGLEGPGLGRGARHLLPDPAGASACKRLLLYLRWMVRPADGVDLGLWADRVPARVLLVPLDVHLHRLALNLGLTERRAATWAAAEEVTARLGRLDPADPVRYDFALCHMGMAGDCPSLADPLRCEGCGVRPLCRHWRGRRPGVRPGAGRARAAGGPGASGPARGPGAAVAARRGATTVLRVIGAKGPRG